MGFLVVGRGLWACESWVPWYTTHVVPIAQRHTQTPGPIGQHPGTSHSATSRGSPSRGIRWNDEPGGTLTQSQTLQKDYPGNVGANPNLKFRLDSATTANKTSKLVLMGMGPSAIVCCRTIDHDVKERRLGPGSVLRPLLIRSEYSWLSCMVSCRQAKGTILTTGLLPHLIFFLFPSLVTL